jgi:cyclic pyranopterin phosphate synthase
MLMTRRDQFDRVRSNIDLMLSEGINVRVNSVVMKGLNDHEISDFVAWTKEQPVHIRFIEFMPFSGNRWDSAKVMTWQEILSRVSDEYDVLPLDREKHDTAKKYIVPGHQGTFAVISTMSAPFCGDCNRMRLTADGKMKNCLFSTSETDLLTAFRNGEDVVPLIHQSIRDKKKALGGQFTTDMGKIETSKLENRSMITIGG